MSGLVKTWLASGLMLALSAAPALASDRPFNLGKIATTEEVAGWDIDVRPDGLGAPVGMGNAIAYNDSNTSPFYQEIDQFEQFLKMGTMQQVQQQIDFL